MNKFNTDKYLNYLKNLSEENNEFKEMYEIALRLAPEQLERVYGIMLMDNIVFGK